MPQPNDVMAEIEQWQRRLQKLREQKAHYGRSADPSIDNEIEEIEARLRRLNAARQGQIAALREGLAAHRKLKAVLPVEQFEATLATLEAQLARLRTEPGTGHRAEISGSGAIAQGEGARSTYADRGGVALGGDIGGDAIVGDNNRQITTIINLYRREGQPQETDESVLRRQITGYLRGVYNRYSRLELRGIKQEGRQVIRLELEQVYVPLAAKTYRSGQIKLDEVLQQGRRVVITGGPGSGKTTVLLHLASTLALALGGDNPALAQERLGLRDDLPLPIYLPLSSYARYRRNLAADCPAERKTLAAFISHYLIEQAQGGFALPADFFEQLLRTGQQVILLLDGLDEVPDEDERGMVRQAIEGLLDNGPELQLVVTCRTAAYKGPAALLGRDFREIAVLPLEAEHIAGLVRQAYALPDVFGGEAGLAEQKSQDLLAAIEKLEAERRRIYGKDTEPLITSPLLVRMLMMVHLSERRLPEQRAELYKKATDNLLLPVDYHPDESVARQIGGLVGGSQSIHRELAQHLAFKMHRRGNTQGRELDGYDLQKIMEQHPSYPELAEDFIRVARSRSSLLEERYGQYRFIHLAFQEFLVASYLVDVKGGEGGYNAIAAYLEQGAVLDSWWREPIVLISGYFSIDRPQAAQKFLRRLAGLDEEAAGRAVTLAPDITLAAAELAGAAAMEWPALPPGLKEDLARRLATVLTTPAATTPGLRAAAGDTLARLGDPRPAVTTVDGMEFCYVPPGPFMMGSPDEDGMAYDDEKPIHKCDIPYSYWLARYPVTVAQWREFVEKSGHKPDDEGSLRDPLNRPVRYVTWYEGLAFCEWLTEKWRGDGLLPVDWRVILPGEAEWEKAARGGLEVPAPGEAIIRSVQAGLAEPEPVLKLSENDRPQRRYPWGDEPEPERANYRDTGLGTTSAVGCFPGGAGPYGAEEMSGNVWEWTRSLFEGYPYEAGDGREDLEAGKDRHRVLRGGSFTLQVRSPVVLCGAGAIPTTGTSTGVFGCFCPHFLPLKPEPSGLCNSESLNSKKERGGRGLRERPRKGEKNSPPRSGSMGSLSWSFEFEGGGGVGPPLAPPAGGILPQREDCAFSPPAGGIKGGRGLLRPYGSRNDRPCGVAGEGEVRRKDQRNQCALRQGVSGSMGRGRLNH